MMIWRWGPPALLSLACIVGVGERLLAEPPPSDRAGQRAPAPPEAFALLDDIELGERLAGWTVLGLTGPKDGALQLDVARDDIRFSITVAARGAVEYPAPRTTDRYDLYYGHPHPRGTEIPENAIRAIMAGVERRVRRNEAKVAVPGLAVPET
jgi:hypothetical protein